MRNAASARSATVTVFAAMTAIAVAILGGYLGYSSNGLGGAVLYAAMLGCGGALFGALLARTALLFSRQWRLLVVIALVLVVSALTWGLRF